MLTDKERDELLTMTAAIKFGRELQRRLMAKDGGSDHPNDLVGMDLFNRASDIAENLIKKHSPYWQGKE
ncbi:hypothetical protein LCGC14_2811810 [marine sediment metagenome]|uniref:Uncharacterized protein n=1 Tax=marine sediment metagenome TaxID=412755 RepID=A0A0F9AT28_9ZZZZ